MAPKVRRQPKQLAKAKAKVLAKAKARSALLARSNERLTARRGAIGLVNELLSEISMNQLTLDPRNHDEGAFARALRILNRRCTSDALQDRLRGAVHKWVENRGRLPNGIELAPATGELHVAPDEVESAPVVPRHRVLLSTFELQSQAFMLTYNSAAFSPETWPAFADHMENLHRRLGSRAFAACLEESLHPVSAGHAGPPSRKFHTHGYLLWTDGIGYRGTDLEEFRFDGVVPRIDKCAAGANARTPRLAALHGLWYVAVQKKGTLATLTNYRPWMDYKPSKEWLTGLYDSHKLGHEEYLALSATFRTGHESRKRDAMSAMADERQTAVRRHLEEEMQALQKEDPLRPARQFDEVNAFLKHFERARWRRPILAIVGGTNLGKSFLGRAVLRQLAEKLGLPKFLEVTVEGDAEPSLEEFDHRVHAGVLLDGVADAQFLHDHREVFQGQVKELKGGRSATMKFAYPYTLCRRGVVATFDMSASNLGYFDNHHWLSDDRNVIVLRLSTEAWETDGPAEE